MNNKTRFSFLVRPDERVALQRLARLDDRSQGATLRRLIRQAARARGILPSVGIKYSQEVYSEQQ